MALLPVEEARDRILKNVKPLPPEAVALDKALGRVLAKPVKAMRDQPPFEGSAMDGYAVIAADVAQVPAELKLIGVSAAGHGFKGKIDARRMRADLHRCAASQGCGCGGDPGECGGSGEGPIRVMQPAQPWRRTCAAGGSTSAVAKCCFPQACGSMRVTSAWRRRAMPLPSCCGAPPRRGADRHG